MQLEILSPLPGAPCTIRGKARGAHHFSAGTRQCPQSGGVNTHALPGLSPGPSPEPQQANCQENVCALTSEVNGQVACFGISLQHLFF